MRFNLPGGQAQRLTHIPILSAISIKHILVWGMRSRAAPWSMPPGRPSCDSNSGCGCALPTPAAQQPSCAAARKWEPGRGTSPENHPPCRAAWTPDGGDPSQPGSNTPWPRCRDLQRGGGVPHQIWVLFPPIFPIEYQSLTSQQMKHTDSKGGCQAPAEAGTEPNQSSQHHQTKGGQREEELAPPQVCKHTQEGELNGIEGGRHSEWKRRFYFFCVEDPKGGLTCAHHVLPAVVVPWFFVFWSELLV